MDANDFDVLVIGGGPGGYVAAIRSAQLGLKTALVEKEHLGGICLNWGCIPTKALLQSSELHDRLIGASQFGVSAGEVSFDLEKIVGRSREIAGQLNRGVGYLLKKNNVTVFEGIARISSVGVVDVESDDGSTEELRTRNTILATGARARVLPDLPIDGEFVWSYKEAMVPKALPKKLLVVGSGAIGIEFACFYNSFGTDVTVVEVLPRILPQEDEEISSLAQKEFEARGMQFRTETAVIALDSEAQSATIECDGEQSEVACDQVISAVGVVPNTEGLGLEALGIRLGQQGFVETDNYCQTNIPGVFAIGDIAGAPCLAHKASHEGVVCVETIAGREHIQPVDRQRIPGCTYSSPQVASIGLTESQAIAGGYDIEVGRFPFSANGKALAIGEPNGLIKTIFDAGTGELLGAHMLGAEVTELINTFSATTALEATIEDLAETVFAHPTLAEMLHESVLDARNHAIHI